MVVQPQIKEDPTSEAFLQRTCRRQEPKKPVGYCRGITNQFPTIIHENFLRGSPWTTLLHCRTPSRRTRRSSVFVKAGDERCCVSVEEPFKNTPGITSICQPLAFCLHHCQPTTNHCKSRCLLIVHRQ